MSDPMYDHDDDDMPRMFDVPRIVPPDPPDAVAAARDEAVGRAGSHANPEWRAAVTRRLATLADRGEPFTADDIWAEVDGLEVSTHDRRALGAIMTGAARAGRIEQVGYARSTRAACHGRPVAVWRGINGTRRDG
jgi:hypothetical protein